MSRPTRARGLKFHAHGVNHDVIMSRPTRARGLKYICAAPVLLDNVVAPHAGAWIEIKENEAQGAKYAVAPHAGAWIEIPHRAAHNKASRSRPTRARGLKFSVLDDGDVEHAVAPHAGAWIEI